MAGRQKGWSVADINRFSPEGDIRALSNKEMDSTTILQLMADSDSLFPKRNAIDFYHHYQQDLKLMAKLGMKTFRTSISWSRVFPRGDEEEPNAEALAWYDRLINAICDCGMQPMITLSHYEMPLTLALEYNGWSDRRLVDLFAVLPESAWKGITIRFDIGFRSIK